MFVYVIICKYIIIDTCAVQLIVKKEERNILMVEKRVGKSTAANMKLETKVKTLESENKLVLLFVLIKVNKWICCFCRLLLTQLRELQAFVSKYNPSKLHGKH